jgi:hypothetical protein
MYIIKLTPCNKLVILDKKNKQFLKQKKYLIENSYGLEKKLVYFQDVDHHE